MTSLFEWLLRPKRRPAPALPPEQPPRPRDVRDGGAVFDDAGDHASPAPVPATPAASGAVAAAAGGAFVLGFEAHAALPEATPGRDPDSSADAAGENGAGEASTPAEADQGGEGADGAHSLDTDGSPSESAGGEGGDGDGGGGDGGGGGD